MKTGILVALLVVSLTMVPIALADDYVGSSTCGQCHTENYETWLENGHHFSLIAISGSVPEYPFDYNYNTPNVTDPPTASGSQLGWDDITYVVAGYYRAAIFTDQDGYIITGDSGDETQWNVWDQEWAPYHTGEQLLLDCGQCHATGYDPSGHQGNLPGISGTWVEDGVGCEACHGPDS